MATSSRKPFRIAPLQRLKVKPIDDPAEQAALDERLKRSEAGMSDGPTPARGSASGIADAEKCNPQSHSRCARRRDSP
jgi:hypothetical protein